MSELRSSPATIREARREDLRRLTEIYNHYVLHTPVTFDVEPYTVETRGAWFEQFATSGRHRLVVAEVAGALEGYAGTLRWRPKAAYDSTVETTIYCSPHATGKGLGRQLYAALFALLAAEDVHRVVAGYTLPNPSSERLHAALGFHPVGVFREVGRKFNQYWDVAWCEKEL